MSTPSLPRLYMYIQYQMKNKWKALYLESVMKTYEHLTASSGIKRLMPCLTESVNIQPFTLKQRLDNIESLKPCYRV